MAKQDKSMKAYELKDNDPKKVSLAIPNVVVSLLVGFVLSGFVLDVSGWLTVPSLDPYFYPLWIGMALMYGFIAYVKIDVKGNLKRKFPVLKFIK